MDRNNHFAAVTPALLCLVSLCLLFCLVAGCERAVVRSAPPPVELDRPDTAGVRLEVVAEAVGNALDKTDCAEPDNNRGDEVVAAVWDSEDIGRTMPAAATENPVEIAEITPEVVSLGDMVAISVEDSLKPEAAATDDPVDISKMPPETAGPEGSVVVSAVETAPTDPVEPVREIFAGTVQAEPVELNEQEAAGEPAKELGLEYPVPIETTELPAKEQQDTADLGDIHIADIPLLANDGAVVSGGDLIQPQGRQDSPDAGTDHTAETTGKKPASKGFAAKYLLRPIGAVLGFATRHFLILGAAAFCIFALLTFKKERMFFRR